MGVYSVSRFISILTIIGRACWWDSVQRSQISCFLAINFSLSPTELRFCLFILSVLGYGTCAMWEVYVLWSLYTPWDLSIVHVTQQDIGALLSWGQHPLNCLMNYAYQTIVRMSVAALVWAVRLCVTKGRLLRIPVTIVKQFLKY